MAWTRIDDNFKNNIKVRKAGGDGVLLYLYGLIHCNTNLTDGYIDEVYLPQLFADAFCKRPKTTVEKLLEVGLWIKVDGGYQVNDFLEYNLTKAEIEKRRQAKVKAGRKGGLISSESKQKTESIPDAQASAQADAQAKFNPITHNPFPLPDNPKDTTTGTTFSDVAKAYEDVCGVLNSVTADKLKLAYSEYEPSWIMDALKETAVQNKRSWAYTEAILKRWKVEGRNSKRTGKPVNTNTPDKFRQYRKAVGA